MPIDVVMPQMGESIFEGTITKWLKKAGDAVQKDEPLFEISTDKVDAEIPSPAAGLLSEIRAAEGETVQVNAVVAVIGDAVAKTGTGQPQGNPAGAAPASQAKAPSERAPASPAPEKPAPSPRATSQPSASAPPASANGTEVVMPQMGESIFEGTITKWLKKAGETVQKDEPLFEISTDKVDAEIPAPVSGVLREIRVPEGETVQVNTVVAVLGGSAAQAQPDGIPAVTATADANLAVEARAQDPPSPASLPAPTADATPEPESGSTAPVRSSPLVRRIARENQLDLRRVQGTGMNGRVTKEDVLSYLEKGSATATAQQIPSSPSSVTPAAVVAPGVTRQQAQAAPPPALEGRLEPMSRMRSIIAQRMVESRQTSPHAYSVYKVDMTRVVRLRERFKASFEQRHGVKLTFMPFIAAAAVDALRRFPIVNGAIEGTAIRYHEHIHLGIAVALEWGLIVPVVRHAEALNFVDMAKSIASLAERARGKKLKPEEASGSTFTLTNSGVFGGEYGTPIINQPEAAILAIGGLKKEPVVLPDTEGNDTIAIRSMQQYCLGFDHRIIDGADAGRFMTAFKDALEQWSTSLD